jgi:hypothetical protein
MASISVQVGPGEAAGQINAHYGADLQKFRIQVHPVVDPGLEALPSSPARNPPGCRRGWQEREPAPAIQTAMYRSTANVSLRKQIHDSDLENFCQIEDIDIEDGANA